MKLKKIASLALAGIMAVSMLTACGEGTNNGNSGSSSSQPTTASVVSTVKNAIADKNGDLVITVEENTALNDAMKKFNEDNKNLYPQLTEATVRDDVLDKVFTTANLVAGDSMLGTNVLSTLINNLTTSDTTGYRYAVVSNGAGASADSVRTLAANAIAESMKDLQNVVVGNNNNTVNISYTMYVYEGSMVTNDNKTEPYVVAVLKATSKTNV